MKNKGISIILSIIVFIVLAGFFAPIFLWYYKAFPPTGADFYQYTTYVKYFSDHLKLPIWSWKYIWFDGLPTFSDYAWLFFYLGIPFAKTWGLVKGAKLFLMLMLFLYGVVTYFLLKTLSKSYLFALGGAIAIIWTLNLYDALMGGGNTTYSCSQIFLPLGLWLLIKYYQTLSKKYLYLLIITTGLSYIGHSGVGLLFVWIPLIIIFALWPSKKIRFFSFRRFLETLTFSFASLGIGFFALYSVAYLVLTIPKLSDFSLTGQFQRFHPPAIIGFFTTQNIFLYATFFLLLLLVLIHGYFKELKKLIPFLAASIYLLFFEWLYVIGRNPFGGALFPSRTYWTFGLILACMAAVLYHIWDKKTKKEFIKWQKIFSWGTKIILFFILISAPISPYASLNEKIFHIDQRRIGVALNLKEYQYPALTTLGTGLDLTIDEKINQKDFTQSDIEELKGSYLPEWLDPNELNFRMHSLRVGVNTWWNSLFKSPISHGAYSSRLLETQNYAYWTDSAIHGELTAHWQVPLEVSKNQALFLIDWRAIKTFYGLDFEVTEKTPYDLKNEGWALGIASYLTKDPKIIDRKGLSDIPIKETIKKEPEQLTFFRVNQKSVSPIIKTTNVPTILIFADKNGYDNILRDLATVNLNSRYLIPVEAGQEVNYSIQELKKFDVVLLNRYKADEDSWKILEQYVKDGGNLIIETNDDSTKESDSRKNLGGKKLPAVFPIEQTIRGDLGKEWEISQGDSSITREIDFASFSSLIYDDLVWNLSYCNYEDVRSWGKVILAQKNQPVLVAGDLGQGKVFWSGINLFYHINRNNNLEEAKFFENILKELIPIRDEGILDFNFSRPKPEQIFVEGQNFKGVVFKENNYGGWKAKLINPKHQKLKVYKAGLGYSYIPIPKDFQNSAKIKIYYLGSFKNWLMFLLSILLILWFLYLIIFGKKFDLFKFKVGGAIKSWWDKEDE